MFNFFLLLFSTAIIYYPLIFIYKLYILDVSSLKTILDNSNKPIVVAVYGHTSWIDTFYGLVIMIKVENLISLAKKKYEKYYPFFVKKYFHFIEKNTTKIILNTHMSIMIEGTRSKTNKLRTGFIYLAKNNRTNVCFICIDLKNNKILCSDVIKYKTISNIENYDELLNHLRYLVKKNNIKNLAFYPEYLSDIN